MKMQNIVVLLLAVFLLAGCVSGAEINSVSLSLDSPTTGGVVPTTASASTGVKATVTWDKGASGTFDAGVVYTATITVEPSSSSNSLASAGTIKLNGNEKTWSVVDGKITVTHTFPETADADPTSVIELSLTKPLAANSPATTATVTKPTKGIKTTVTWSPNDGKFKLGESYTAKIVIESTNPKAYPISSDATVKVNGEKISSPVRDGNSKVTVTYNFGKTEPKGTADILSFTVNAPVVGEKPSNYLRTNAYTEMIAATAAWDTTSPFHADTPYTVTITVYANEGYVIKNTAAAKVNGNNAVLNWISDSKATVTYRFAEIASVGSVNVNFAPPATGEVAKTSASSVTTFPADAAKSAEIKWTPSLTAGEFDAGVEYTAEVTIPVSGSNIVFDEETIVYINDAKAAVVSVSNDGKSIKATHTFPKTTFIPNPIDIIKEFYNLMLAIFNPASYVF